MAASTLTRLRLPSPNPETLPFESPSNKQSASPTPDALTAAAAAAAASAGRPEMRQRLLRHGRVFEQLTERTLERTAEQRPPLQRAMSDSFRAESISKRGLPSSREGRPFSPSAGFQFASPRFANIFEESSADSGGVGTSSEEESDDGEGGDEESASSENPRMGARRPRFELRANAPADPRSLQRGQPSRRASHEVPLVGEEGTSKASLRESSFAAAVIAEERRLRAAAAAEDKRSALPRLLKTQRESRAAVAPRGFPESESEEDPEDEDGQSSSCSKSSGCSSSEDSTRQADAAFRDSRQARAFAQRNLREVTRRRQAAMERHMQKQRLQLESCQRAFSPREAQNGPSSRGGDLKVKSSHDARRVNGRRGSRCVRPSFGGESSVSQTTVGGDVWQRAAKMTREKSASSASGPSVAPSSLPFASQNAHPPSSFFGPMPPPPPLAFLGWPSAPHLYTAAAAAFAAAAARGGRGAGTETPASAGPPQATGAEGKTTLHAEEQAIERKHQELETARRLQELSEKLSEAHEDLRNEREKASELRRNREDLERRLKEKDSALKAQSAELETARAETKRETEAKEAAEQKVASLQQELLGLSKAHAEVKEILTTEKEGLAKQKAELEAKVKDLSEDLDFAKNQLLVARESVIAARQKQQAATEAHEEDLKALKAYRKENEVLRQDLKFLETLNASLAEKAQRLMHDSGIGRSGSGEALTLSARNKGGGRLSPKAALALRQTQTAEGPASPASFTSDAGASTRSAVYSQLLRLLDRQSSEAASERSACCAPQAGEHKRPPRTAKASLGVPSSNETKGSESLSAGKGVDGEGCSPGESCDRGAVATSALKVAAETRSCERQLARLQAQLAALEAAKQGQGQGQGQDSSVVASCGPQLERVRTEDGPERPLLPPLPFSSRVPSEYRALMEAAQRHRVSQPCLRDPFPLHNFAPGREEDVVRESQRQSPSQEEASPAGPSVFSSVPGLAIPQPPPEEAAVGAAASVSRDSVSWKTNAEGREGGGIEKSLPTTASVRTRSPATESVRSCASASSNARSQWLLQRVSRISRLHGLEQIHQKMQDLSPTLSEISRSARRAVEAEKARGASTERSLGSAGFSSESGGSSERRELEAALQQGKSSSRTCAREERHPTSQEDLLSAV